VVFLEMLGHATRMRKLGYLVAVTLVFVGCGSDDDDSGSNGTGGTSSGGSGGSTGGSGGSTGGSGGSTGGSGGSTGGSGGATGGTAGAATGGTAGTATGGTAGAATGGAAGAAGSPNVDAGTGGKPNIDAGNGCNASAQCKLFSSYCANAPCQCIALNVNEKDPVCQGGQVPCTIDPCLNKQAACVNGACVIAP
jgi:hypothetical protein